MILFFRNESNSNELDFFIKLSQLSINTWTEFTKDYLNEEILDKETNIKELVYNVNIFLMKKLK